MKRIRRKRGRGRGRGRVSEEEKEETAGGREQHDRDRATTNFGQEKLRELQWSQKIRGFHHERNGQKTQIMTGSKARKEGLSIHLHLLKTS